MGEEFRLITEAEWKDACRKGGKKIRFGNGKDEISDVPTQAGGSYSPNRLGLIDFSGNVADWTEDKYQKSCQGLPELNPLFQNGRSNAVRGGNIVNLLPDTEPKHILCSGRGQSRSILDQFDL